MREELIQSAVSFLQDPQVASSPLAKKIEFIESKGLSPEEIQEALRRTENTSSRTPETLDRTVGSNAPTAPPVAPYMPPVAYYNAPPVVPARDWKDYFVMATTSVGVAYGLYQVITRYVIPNLVPPSKSDVEADKEAIDEEFLRIDSVLNEISEQNAATAKQSAEKLEELGGLSTKIGEFLISTTSLASLSKEDIRLMKQELDTLKQEVTTGMSVQKNRIETEFSSIQQELQSLKALILTRKEVDLRPSMGRKVPAVSSIPSAKDILEREKAKTAVVETPASTSTSKESTPIVEAAPDSEVTTTKEGSLTPPPPPQAHLSGAGIPAWQQAANKALENDGIPAWQKAANA